MKKILVVLSLICFVAVNISKAQTASTAAKPEAKTETAAVKAEAPAAKSCCQHSNAACCKSSKEAKACTPEQKAACAKMGDKAKAEAVVEPVKAKGSN